MPRGKELEQLPMANIAPGAGKDSSPTNRDILTSGYSNEGPFPSKAGDHKKKNL